MTPWERKRDDCTELYYAARLVMAKAEQLWSELNGESPRGEYGVECLTTSQALSKAQSCLARTKEIHERIFKFFPYLKP